MGLQIADEDEQQKKACKKKKRKSEVECGAEEKGAEHWVEKRQRKRARKEEEAQKRKRTVFVGNLPISCTKKVGGGSSFISGSGVGAAVLTEPRSCFRCSRTCSGRKDPSSPSAFALWYKHLSG